MRKINLFFMMSALCLIALPQASADPIEIQAHIDGRDQLLIQGNTLQWHHFDFSAVGRHVGANSPTIVDPGDYGREWIPEWPELPPAEIRYEAYSSFFENLYPEFPTDEKPWEVVKLFGRGEVEIVQQPTAVNAYTLVVEFNDNAYGGSNFYIVTLSEIADSEHDDNDGDGIPDEVDKCHNSNLSAEVIIDGCASGAGNSLDDNGCTVSDRIAECAENATNHGRFVNCVAHLKKDLQKTGVITNKEQGKIQRCAAKANIPD